MNKRDKRGMQPRCECGRITKKWGKPCERCHAIENRRPFAIIHRSEPKKEKEEERDSA